MTGKYLDRLLDDLKSDDSEVCEAAVKALGELGDARAVEPLIKALADESEYVCKAAVEALGEIGDVRAVEPLIDIAARNGIAWESVRASIAKALGQLGPYTDSNYRSRASDWLFENFWWAPPEEAYRGGRSEFFRRDYSGNWDGSIIPSFDVRVAAAWSLGEIGDAGNLLVVVGTGVDEWDRPWSVEVRKAVAMALEKSSGKPIVEYLIDALEVQPAAAAWMLGDIGDARAVEPLIEALGNDDEDVCDAAKEALKKLGHEVE